MSPSEVNLRRQYEVKIASAATAAEIDAIEQELFGRKAGVLIVLMRELRGLKAEEKRKRGSPLNELKRTLEHMIADRRSALTRESKHVESMDLSAPLPPPPRGHLHPIHEFIDEVEEVFGRMGFDVAYGPEIETEDYNFTLLNIPEGHPARDAMGTFFVRLPSGERRVLRTHTSPVQIRYMQTHTPPFRMICPGKVYRKDDDATHSPMFHQFEGLMVGEDVSLAHLKGVMIAAVKELISPEVTFRFRASYFPFTEPSMEMDIQWKRGEQEEPQWLEIAGCGLVHPQVLRNVKIDPQMWSGFAFGFGVERLLMIRHRIPDLRLFFENDPQFLEQF